jgi:glycine dehydrogenase subunit 1
MFIPHTLSEQEEMLRAIGVQKLEDLFKDVPESYRFPEINLPPSLSEMETLELLNELASANETTQDLVCFLGAGAYNHYIPAAVDAILRRGEFLTAYTPYQAEISQGTLQAIFEYQSMMSALTGMELCNASHYDGATAMAEAGVMTYHHFRGKKQRLLISPAINPEYRDTLRTYLCEARELEIVGDEEDQDPLITPDELAKKIDQNTAMVAVQYPDFFGRVFDYSDLAKKTHEAGALFVVAVNPLSLGLLTPPGKFGADIVVGEGQPLGIPLSFGGPYLGIFATKKQYIHKMAGRLAGQTSDADGKRGYVLTLTAREQHIRREKATSNICTNQGLMALAVTVYLSLLGKKGLRDVANLCYQKAHYAAKRISSIPGYKLCFNTPFFNEFSICCPKPVEEINTHLLDHGVLGGYDLGKRYPTLCDHMVIAVTEMNTREQIDLLCEILEEVSHD